MTASTGISALQFHNGMTIHKWSGIGDCHLGRNATLQMIMTDNSYESVKKNICETDCLIIDEIGMFSGQNFGDVEYLCRKVRNSQTIFGGMQVIASGCFKQLPPVASV